MKSEQNNRKIKTIFLSLSVIMIIVSAFIIMPTFYPEQKTENKQVPITRMEIYNAFSKLSPQLNITIVDSEGNIKNQEIKEDDLILTNFVNWLAALFTDSDGAGVTYTNYDTGGTIRTLRTYGTSAQYFFNDVSSSGGWDRGGKIGIGNGTTSPARDDYMLEDMQESWVNISPASYGGGNITFSGTVAMTNDYSASEVGFMFGWTDTVATYRQILMFRDTYTPFPVVVGDQLFATYTIFLNNTGFTNNFGNFLTSLFQHTQTNKYFNTTDIDAVSRTFFAYQMWDTGISATINYATDSRRYIGMSVDAGGFTRSSFRLVNVIGPYLGVAQPSNNLTALMIVASQSMPSTGTMNSAGFFTVWGSSDGTPRQIMLWALNFTAVPYNQDYSVTVAFQLIL